MKAKKILFIINPISGQGKGKKVKALIESYLDYNRFEPYFLFTEFGGHARNIAASAASEQYEIIVAVGGDGTYSEVASSLVGKQIALGLIPIGSGNGMAGHLGISLDCKKAILQLNNAKILTIDTATCNGVHFIGVFGVGFDAKVAAKFAKRHKRGFWGYVKTITREYLQYRSALYTLNVDGLERDIEAFILCVANASEYGNKAIISPNSVLNDEQLNVVVIQKIPVLALPFFLWKLFNGRVNSSNYFNEYVGKKVKLFQEEKIAHIDGEPFKVGNQIFIEVHPKSLRLFY